MAAPFLESLRPSYLESLPFDLVRLIFSNLDVRSLGRCGCVSRTWRNWIDDPYYWRRYLPPMIKNVHFGALRPKEMAYYAMELGSQDLTRFMSPYLSNCCFNPFVQNSPSLKNCLSAIRCFYFQRWNFFFISLGMRAPDIATEGRRFAAVRSRSSVVKASLWLLCVVAFIFLLLSYKACYDPVLPFLRPLPFYVRTALFAPAYGAFRGVAYQLLPKSPALRSFIDFLLPIIVFLSRPWFLIDPIHHFLDHLPYTLGIAALAYPYWKWKEYWFSLLLPVAHFWQLFLPLLIFIEALTACASGVALTEDMRYDMIQ